ncbi:optineurin isoform X1 [Syngnathus typhle]|uniref:optineurin isoform X1 n=1 Tax=Syngnathus typhle TaxID=161592 RepID=UPI002A6A33C5|nr:optineurin isoform X1 [Syngnathus typhle]
MGSVEPVLNGDTARSPSMVETSEEALVQMKTLIQENRNLKEALRQTNLSMKERFEELFSWREKQRQERVFLETRLGEARVQLEALAMENQELSKNVTQSPCALDGSQVMPSGHSAETDALRALVSRLQAEKNDLVALNSELHLKCQPNSCEDSFIEIVTVSDEVGVLKDASESSKHLDASMTASRLDSEEVTVSHLLQSLRNETQRAERLQAELQATVDIIRTMEEKKSQHATITTQTSLTEETRNNSEKVEVASEFIRSQMMALVQKLQLAQSKLDEAEGMKKNLQERCHEMENDVAALRAQLVDTQAVKSQNEKLKVQLDSIKAQSLMVQKRSGEERSNLAQLKDAYAKLFEDYNELQEEQKKREAGLVGKEVVDDLKSQLSAAEKALATKQEHIDILKQEVFKKEKELESISVLEAQAEVYASDFFAERAAREKLHEERERLSVQLEYVKKQNIHLQERSRKKKIFHLPQLSAANTNSINCLQTLGEMQRRHVPNPNAQGQALVSRGTNWQRQGGIPAHVCPKCEAILPDLDTLQIHIMDCIN